MALNDAKVGPAIPVTDMSKVKDFYEGKLGLTGGVEQGDGGTTYPCGGGTAIHVYPSPDNAGKSGATLANFYVGDDLEAAIDELSSKGITFEQYDMEGLKTNEKGIADFGEGQSGAWMKDPEGNTLAVSNTWVDV